MSTLYELGVYTASSEIYANEVVRNLDPGRKMIRFILSRKDCIEIKDGVYIKDLNIVKNRHAQCIFLIDNYAHSYINQADNGIPIVPFYDNGQDDELLKLQSYLTDLSKMDDAFAFNRDYFFNEKILACRSSDEIDTLLKSRLKVSHK